MRFFADGPCIPEELLEQRDRGKVVFFCGAGVSIPAGLPDFRGLTKRVMAALGTSSQAKSRWQFELSTEASNLDQVFNLLKLEYRPDEVEDVVSRILKTPRRADVEAHSVILRLSRNARKQPQVVTTNFDLLFERADKSITVHIPPALPDLASVGSFDGVVYLHGRRADRPSTVAVRQRLVLSSSDFGRAYLADGWATRFVRDLLETYVIVLVGYAASDPPVRYLLEGLHSRGENKSAGILAFDCGAEDDVRDRWRSLGAQTLPYRRDSDSGHGVLWNSLRAWANQADDPHAWRQSIVDLSQGNPKQLESHQRGQVAALVRTTEGAALFASATPPPPAEWLCVFDRLVRYAEPQSAFGSDEPDPLSEYGLDDDPPRPEQPAPNAIDPVGDDLISLSSRDERMDRHKRLAGISTRASDPLPPRLAHLAQWFTRVADDPVAVWWAAGYETMHFQVLAGIQWTLQHKENAFRDLGSRAWRVLLERFHYSPEDRHGWYTLLPRLKREGWTGPILREFERVVLPHVTAKRASQYRLHPPAAAGPSSRLRDVVDLEVEFPGCDRHGMEIPSGMLPAVFDNVRRGLRRGADLLAEIETDYWHTVSFHLPIPGRRKPGSASGKIWMAPDFDEMPSEFRDPAAPGRGAGRDQEKR